MGTPHPNEGSVRTHIVKRAGELAPARLPWVQIGAYAAPRKDAGRGQHYTPTRATAKGDRGGLGFRRLRGGSQSPVAARGNSTYSPAGVDRCLIVRLRFHHPHTDG